MSITMDYWDGGHHVAYHGLLGVWSSCPLPWTIGMVVTMSITMDYWDGGHHVHYHGLLRVKSPCPFLWAIKSKVPCPLPWTIESEVTMSINMDHVPYHDELLRLLGIR